MPYGLKWRFCGQNGGRGNATLTPNELVLPFGGSYVCANFCENRSRNATVRVLTDGTHTLTDANRLYNRSHAECYRYGTDNNIDGKKLSVSVCVLTGIPHIITAIRRDLHSCMHGCTTDELSSQTKTGSVRPSLLGLQVLIYVLI